MKKTLLATVAISLLVGLAPAPAQAFDLGEAVSSFTDSIQQKFRRAYLALPGEKSGDAVLEQTGLALENVQTVTTDAKIDVKATQADEELLGLSLSFIGPVEVTDVFELGSYKQDWRFVGSMTAEGTTLTADADIKILDETTFVKFNQLPTIPFLQVSDLKDQWLRFEQTEAIEGMTVLEGTPQEGNAEDLAAQGQMMVDVTPELTPEQQQQQDEQAEQYFLELLMKAEASPARREKAGDVNVFAFELAMADEDILTYVRQMEELTGSTAEEADESVSEIATFLEATSPINLALKVDRSTFFLVELELPLTIDVASLDSDATEELTTQLVPLGDVSDADTAEVVLKFMFSDYNQPIEFTVPTDARDANEVFSEVMGQAMGLPAGVTMQAPSSAAGSTGGRMALPGSVPVEMPTLTPEEEEILKQYGIDPADLR